MKERIISAVKDAIMTVFILMCGTLAFTRKMCSVYGVGFCEGGQTPAQFAKSMGYDYIHSVTTVIVSREDNYPAKYYVIEVSN